MVKFSKFVNIPVLFQPTGNPMPTSHTWKINNEIVSNNKSFYHTFTSAGIYDVTHEGSDICGESYPVTNIIEITKPIEQSSMSMEIIGLGLIVGYMFMKNK